MITSSEFSIASAAVRLNKKRLAGASLRLIDVPVILGKKNDIFDRANDADIIKSRVWREETYREIVKSCKLNHGAAFDAYIESLIEQGDEKRTIALAHIEKFACAVGGKNDDEQLNDLTRKFGLLYAGAMMGISARVVSWTPESALEAIVTSYGLARQIFRPLDKVEPRERLIKLIAGLPFRSAGMDFDSVDGFRTRGLGVATWVIKKEVLTRLLGSASWDGLSSELVQADMVLTTTSRKTSRKVPREQTDWPDGVRRRSITILRPRDL